MSALPSMATSPADTHSARLHVADPRRPVEYLEMSNNRGSSPRLYATISRGGRPSSTEPSHSDPLRKATPAIYEPPMAPFPQLSPILQKTQSDAPIELLPAPLSVGQTPWPENNYWLNPGDRFIFLGGDDENFLAYVVETTHRAALVHFECKVTHKDTGSKEDCVHWFPYVESTRVFSVDPGRLWFRFLARFESVAQARELGVPKRKWMCLDGRDQRSREEPDDFARGRMMRFVKALLGYSPDASGTWDVQWELFDGTAEKAGVRSGWNWDADLKVCHTHFGQR